MNQLEQRLADELDAIVAELGTPLIDVARLEAAGRRARVLGRVVPGLAAVTAAAAVVAGLVYVLPHQGWPGTDSEDAPNVATDGASDLGRPLGLPWWGWDGVSADPSVGLLRVGNLEVPVDGVTAVLAGGEVTLIEQDPGAWSVLDNDVLRPLFDALLDAPPVVGVDGVVAYVVPRGPDGHTLVRDQGGDRSELPVDGARPVVVGVDGGRVLVTVGEELLVWRSGATSLEQVTGLPGDPQADQFAARPGGIAIQENDTLLAGAIKGTKFRTLWQTPWTGSGVWSSDGDIYAAVSGGKVVFSTEAGQAGTSAVLPTDHMRVVGWENDSEVIVAQWIEVDGAVTGVWRCSAAAIRCAQIEDPNGRAVLPGLPAG